MFPAPRFRPRGRIRHLLGLLAPGTATMAATIAFARDRDVRSQRLVAAARDRIRERTRPTRPRMRALTAAAGGRLSWRDVPAPPRPGPLAAVVRPIAVATCDIDRAIALGVTPFPLPLHFGHECVAEVIAVGERVTTLAAGQRVVVPFQISCGTCAPCSAGHTANCTGVPPISMYGFGLAGGHWGGAFSDELAVPFADAMLVPLPAGIDPAWVASVADTVCDGYRHIAPHLPELLRRDPDAAVTIVGADRPRSPFSASVSLYAGLIALALGARTVHVVDARPTVRAHAERLGLRSLRPADLHKHSPAPLVVDASASPSGLHSALATTAPDGVCSSLGGLYPSARIPLGLLYGRNASFHVGRTHARALIPAVLDLVTSGRLRPQDVTTCVAPLDDAPRALREHVLGDGTKTILVAE